MSAQFLSAFSKYVSVPILCDWLEINSVTNFDSAACNKLIRPVFLSLIGSEFSLFEGTYHVKLERSVLSFECFLSWVELRSISLKSLGLNNFDSVQLFEFCYFQLKSPSYQNVKSLVVISKLTGDEVELRFAVLTMFSTVLKKLEVLTIDGYFNHVLEPEPKRLISFPNLTELIVRNCDDFNSVIFKVTEKCSKLQKMTLFGNDIGESDLEPQRTLAESLTEMFKTNCSVRELTFGRRYISDPHIKIITEMCLKLTFISIRGNNVTNDSIKMLFQKCTLLEHITLRCCNHIDDTVFEVIKCSELKSFSLSDSKHITEIGIKCILEQCKELQSVKILRCDKVDSNFITNLRQPETKHDLHISCSE
jgi:hypothetical protein